MSNDLQGPFWRRTRLGVVTASRFGDCLMKPSTKGFQKVIWDILAGALTDEPPPEVSAPPLSWGKMHEQQALDRYELESGNETYQTGLIYHPDSPFIGASPDALIGERGGCEIKCPYDSGEHIGNVLRGMDPKHIPQVQGGMWICERSWWDFISFDPRVMFPNLQFYVERVERDDEYIETKLIPAVTGVVEEANRAFEQLMEADYEVSPASY